MSRTIHKNLNGYGYNFCPPAQNFDPSSMLEVSRNGLQHKQNINNTHTVIKHNTCQYRSHHDDLCSIQLVPIGNMDTLTLTHTHSHSHTHTHTLTHTHSHTHTHTFTHSHTHNTTTCYLNYAHLKTAITDSFIERQSNPNSALVIRVQYTSLRADHLQ